MNIDIAMFHQAFFDEATDLLADLEGLLLRLEEEPNDPELLNTIFRCAHSLKGGSSTFGFTDIAALTHSLETLLDQVRNGLKPVTRMLTQLLFESLDQLNALLAVARGEREKARDSSGLIARIDAAIHDDAVVPPSGASAAPAPDQAAITDADGSWGVWSLAHRWRIRFFPGPDTLRRGFDPALLIKQLGEAGEILSVACDTSRLPGLADMEPETCYLGWDVELRTDVTEPALREIFEFIAEESEIEVVQLDGAEPAGEKAGATTSAAPETEGGLQSEPALARIDASASEPAGPSADGLKAPGRDEHPADHGAADHGAADHGAAEPGTPSGARAASGAPESHTLRVSTEKVDKLINLVGELVINQSMLNEVVNGFTMDRLPRLLEAVAQVERASRDLQERVMAVRLLPIKHAFGRFPRLVRDQASACGKKIELKTSGEETELDKSVIEVIVDPLTHLVRNAIDHGLETPAERRAAGKPETCTLALHAFQEGGNIIVEVTDDGRGLDRERIRRKAIERGLASESDTLSDDAVFNFIFQSGFSTAPEVTDLSGRGVGMDIVRRAVQGLGGTINLTTTPGQGTRFRIRLPLTMAIMDGLTLSVGSEIYILPLTSIVESVQPRPGDVRSIAGTGEVVLVRGEVLPILRLYQVFGSSPRFTDPTQALLVILGNDGRKVALLVDELVGQNQVVIKSLEANYRKVPGIAGATILGDGRVALILDVPGLLSGFSARNGLHMMAA